jgi:cob(I)alamin adenosyltransferase
MVTVHVYTGEGGGKTTAALGLAMRACGHGKRVVMIQFLKGRKDIGEYKVQKRIPGFRIYQFGRKDFVNPLAPSQADMDFARKGLDFAYKIAKENPDVIILDEVNIACKFGLLKPKEVLDFLDSAPRKTLVIMTGRGCPKEFMQRAELVIKMTQLKSPRGLVTRKGIEW